MNIEPLYQYRAAVQTITDGDTFLADVDLGMLVHKHARIRLLRLDTPEKREDRHGWELARQRLTSMVNGQPLVVRTRKDRTTFDRWLADAWIPGDEGWVNVSDEMREQYGYPEWTP